MPPQPGLHSGLLITQSTCFYNRQIVQPPAASQYSWSRPPFFANHLSNLGCFLHAGLPAAGTTAEPLSNMEDAEPNGAATIPSDGGAERPVLGNGDGAGAAAYVNDFQPRDDLPDFERYPLMHTLEGHTGAVTAARFRLDGARLASASADGTAKVWDVQAGRALHTLQGHGQVGAIRHV